MKPVRLKRGGKDRNPFMRSFVFPLFISQHASEDTTFLLISPSVIISDRITHFNGGCILLFLILDQTH